jgi:transcriptional regulator with XRE-family HTH domain
MDSIYQFVGQRLRERRLQLELTQKSLAEKADISVAFLSFLETGHRKGSLQTYADLAHCLGLSLEQLFKTAPSRGKHRYQDPPPAAFAGLSVSESAAVEQLVKALRRKR